MTIIYCRECGRIGQDGRWQWHHFPLAEELILAAARYCKEPLDVRSNYSTRLRKEGRCSAVSAISVRRPEVEALYLVGGQGAVDLLALTEHRDKLPGDILLDLEIYGLLPRT